jgi:DNA modification methylase
LSKRMNPNADQGTGEAALLAGRKFLGVEIDSRYYKAAGERLREGSELRAIASQAQLAEFFVKEAA